MIDPNDIRKLEFTEIECSYLYALCANRLSELQDFSHHLKGYYGLKPTDFIDEYIENEKKKYLTICQKLVKDN